MGQYQLLLSLLPVSLDLRPAQRLLTAVTEEQKKDKAYLKRFLNSPSIHDHITGFKQKLEDARSNLTVRVRFNVLYRLY
jgi:hypothetical protein